MPNCPAELVPDFLDEDGYLVWVDLCEPTHEQLARLEQELALDPLAIADAVANLERTKTIRYGRYTVLTGYATYLDPANADTATKANVRSRRNPRNDDPPPGSVLRLDQLSIFVLPRGVVTIRRP
jgi:magnesium transporter